MNREPLSFVLVTMIVGVGDGVGVGGGYVPAVFSASVQKAAMLPPSPDDHFTAGPHRRMVRTGRWCVDRGSGYPAIRTGIVSSSGHQVAANTIASPDNHFTAAPDCRLKLSASRRVSSVRCCPTVRPGIVSAASVHKAAAVVSAPDDHLTASPHCCVIASGHGRISSAGGHPAVSAGIVSPSTLEIMIVTVKIIPSPHDHLSARPYGGVIRPANWRIRYAGGCPTIATGIISPAGVYEIRCRSLRPRRSFHYQSILLCDQLGLRRIGEAGGGPSIRIGVVSPAGIQVAGGILTAPDDHFTAGPDCRVKSPLRGALVMAVGVQVSVAGLYFPPEFK